MDRNKIPGVGMRMVKTAVAVVLCYFIFLPFWLRTPVGEYDPLKDVGPFYACIAAVICMQSSVEQSVRQGVSRVIGTCIGGVVGLAILFVDDLLNRPIVLGLMIGLGIILTMWICNLIHRPAACSIGSILVCVVILNHGGPDRYLYTLFRVLETIVGIAVAVGVNHFLPDRREEPPAKGEKKAPEGCANGASSGVVPAGGETKERS